jgi:eukaryotic-like serine/threonine-protein kinase
MDRHDQSAQASVGDVLAGKYRVDRVLGAGGMGVVVAAHHLHLDERVAIKFLLPEMLGNQDAVMRFAREARAAVKIKSEHVARVTDVGTLDTGAPYMVMEYLEGNDLAALLTNGPLPVEQAVDYLLQACEAIAEAHALGIVHRDLKPANLFLARLPGGIMSVKVLDFGISKLTGLSGSSGQDSATRTKALLGSPLYMSPEQMQSSKDVDARSDIWALGVILYELIAGASPFTADTMPELILKIMSTAPVPLRSVRPDVPEAVEAAVMRCLTKDRLQRFQTVGELAGALAAFGSKKARISLDRISQVMGAAGMAGSVAFRQPDSVAPASAVGAGTAGAFGTSVAKPLRANPLALVGVAALALLGLTGVALAGRWLFQSDRSSEVKEGLPSAELTSKPVSAAVVPAPPAPEAPRSKAVPSSAMAPVASAVPSTTTAASGAPSSAPPVPVKRTLRPAVKAATTQAAPPPVEKKKPSSSSLIDERY